MNDNTVARFWDNFIQKSENYGVKDSAIRWHVLHAEAFIKAHPGLRLFEHTPQHIEEYLREMGQKPHLKDWQYRQVIKALQILFVELVKAEWTPHFHWQDHIDAAIALPTDQATITIKTSIVILPIIPDLLRLVS